MLSFFDELFAAFGSKFSSKIGLIPEITSVQVVTSGLGITSKQELSELLSDFMDVPENIALVKSIDELPDVKRILGLIEANALKHANIERIKRNTAIVEHLATCKNCGHDESDWTTELKQAVNHCRNMFSPEFQAAMNGEPTTTGYLANKQISIYKATFEWLSFLSASFPCFGFYFRLIFRNSNNSSYFVKQFRIFIKIVSKNKVANK